MTENLIRSLADVPDASRLLARAFKESWPGFFADRSAEQIEQALFVAGEPLPAILVAEVEGRVAGTVALRERSVETHEHLGPWVTGLWVAPDLRRLGLGRELLLAITEEAAARGFREIHAVTNTARWLFDKLGWERIEEIVYHGEEVTLYRKGPQGHQGRQGQPRSSP